MRWHSMRVSCMISQKPIADAHPLSPHSTILRTRPSIRSLLYSNHLYPLRENEAIKCSLISTASFWSSFSSRKLICTSWPTEHTTQAPINHTKQYGYADRDAQKASEPSHSGAFEGGATSSSRVSSNCNIHGNVPGIDDGTTVPRA